MAPTARAAASALADIVPRLGRIISATLQGDAEVALTLRQYRTLERLLERPHRTTELASASNVSQPTVTTVVAALETRGLVRREPDPEDGRASLIEITPKGVDLYNEAHDLLIRRLTEVTSHLDVDSLALVVRVSEALAHGMNRAKELRTSNGGQIT